LRASKTPTSSSWKPETRNPIHEKTGLEALPPQNSNLGNTVLCSKRKREIIQRKREVIQRKREVIQRKREVIQKKRVKRFPPQEFLRSTWINSCKKESIDVNI
jgi:hypothetical protein